MMPLKVVHFFGGAWSPGATAGARVLHRALGRLGVTSKAYSLGWDARLAEDERPLAETSLQKIWERAAYALERWPKRSPHGDAVPFHSAYAGHSRGTLSKAAANADLLHFHWLSHGLTALSTLPKLDRPSIITARDQWLGTGGCHYSVQCDNYKRGCGRCPLLLRPSRADQSARNLRWKRQVLESPKLQLVAPSQWLAERLSESGVIDRERIICIPNGIDFSRFPLGQRESARALLGVGQHESVVLMVADQLDSAWKGVTETLGLLNALELQNTRLLLVGRGDVDTRGRTIPTRSLGYLQDPLALALAYNAADVLLCPSTHEAFGKVLVEAAACGTPAIALRDTGAGEVNSTLGNVVVERMDLDSLGAALLPILAHPLGEAGRRDLRARGEHHYGAERVATQYLDLYQHMAGC